MVVRPPVAIFVTAENLHAGEGHIDGAGVEVKKKFVLRHKLECLSLKSYDRLI